MAPTMGRPMNNADEPAGQPGQTTPAKYRLRTLDGAGGVAPLLDIFVIVGRGPGRCRLFFFFASASVWLLLLLLLLLLLVRFGVVGLAFFSARLVDPLA